MESLDPERQDNGSHQYQHDNIMANSVLISPPCGSDKWRNPFVMSGVQLDVDKFDGVVQALDIEDEGKV